MFDDVGYARSYHPELEPGTLRLLAALAGLRPPRGEAFSYCELGSGAGTTLNALAAAYPGARFLGVDRSPADVAFARERAEEAELENVAHVTASIEDLAPFGRGEFDFIGMHGVWTWISRDAQRAAAAFARDHLAPDGLLFVSYNALPGWAAVAPLRALLRAEAARATGTPLERAREAVSRAVALRDAGAGYFTQTPAAAAMLTRLASMDLRYVVHEHLVSEWHPMSSSDVAATLAEADLHRVGQLPLWENVLELSTPERALSIVREARARGDDAFAEATKDLVVNRFFRRDVFCRGAPRVDVTGSAAFFLETPIGAVTCAPPDEVALAHHTARFSGAVFGPLLAALGARATPLLALARDLGVAGFAEADVVEAGRNLLLAGVARPFSLPTRTPERFTDADVALPVTVALAHDRAALARAVEDDGPAVLASRALGAGVIVPTRHAAALAGLAGLAPAAPGDASFAATLRDLAKLGVVARG